MDLPELKGLEQFSYMGIPPQISKQIDEFRSDPLIIGMFDFENIQEDSDLVQMLTNRVLDMGSHIRSDHHNQVETFRECISDGFIYVQERLGAKYDDTALPRLYSAFDNLYNSFKEKALDQ